MDVLTVEEAAKIGRYDVALFFGPGLRLNGDQAADIEAAGAKGTAVYTLIFVRRRLRRDGAGSGDRKN